MRTYFEDGNTKSKKEFECKSSSSVLESVDKVVIFATTSESVIVSVTRLWLILRLISTELACRTTLSKEAVYVLTMDT